MSQPMTIAPDTDVASVLQQVNRVLDQVADPRAWRLPDEQLAEQTQAAYRTATRVHALGLRLLAEVDARGVPERVGASSTQVWLKHTQRMRPETAKRDVQLARLLVPAPAGDTGVVVWADGDATMTEGPPVGAATGLALAGGRLGVEQAACVVRALHELPEDASEQTRRAVEDTMIEQAAHHDPVVLTRLGHRILEYVDPDAADRQLADRLAREEREARRKRSATR
ncbi:MAG: DUF222 domain-containing protein, partial [Propionibacteriales bacterium]|nr:DUF222 domain-containing protein [Propionibacteriales bacterium]